MLEMTNAIGLALALAVAMMTPGPTITAIVARTIAKGRDGSPRLVFGLLLGDLFWLSTAVFGLTAIAQYAAPVFTTIKWIGAFYLFYMAWKLWTAAPALGEGNADMVDQPHLVWTGLSLGLGNPKPALFYLGLLPQLVDLQALTGAGIAEIALMVCVIFTGVLTGYILLADKARRFFRSSAALKRINRTSGVIIAGAASTIVLRG